MRLLSAAAVAGIDAGCCVQNHYHCHARGGNVESCQLVEDVENWKLAAAGVVGAAGRDVHTGREGNCWVVLPRRTTRSSCAGVKSCSSAGQVSSGPFLYPGADPDLGCMIPEAYWMAVVVEGG